MTMTYVTVGARGYIRRRGGSGGRGGGAARRQGERAGWLIIVGLWIIIGEVVIVN